MHALRSADGGELLGMVAFDLQLTTISSSLYNLLTHNSRCAQRWARVPRPGSKVCHRVSWLACAQLVGVHHRAKRRERRSGCPMAACGAGSGCNLLETFVKA
jgi:hypothetical protein